MAVYIINNALSAASLDCLRKECDHQLAVTTNFADKSCVIDLFENTNIGDTAPARTIEEDYLASRWKSVPSTLLSKGECSVISEVIFRTIPQIVSRVYQWSAVILFNEHYIVKLPRGPELFRWHTDAAEQLMMFPYPGALTLSPYVSVWAPLDDCSEANGTLRVPTDTPVHTIDMAAVVADTIDAAAVPSLTEVGSMEQLRAIPAPETGGGKEAGGKALEVPAGSLVLFGYDLYHCSGRNLSDRHRRVFYAQYSQRPITATSPGVAAAKQPGHRQQTPLNFAVPCGQPSVRSRSRDEQARGSDTKAVAVPDSTKRRRTS